MMAFFCNNTEELFQYINKVKILIKLCKKHKESFEYLIFNISTLTPPLIQFDNYAYWLLFLSIHNCLSLSVLLQLLMHHQENMSDSMKLIPPHIPLLYSKNGVWRGIPTFLIFSPKHILWVLVGTALRRQF